MKTVTEGINELIVEYFKIDILKQNLRPETRQNIIDTFTYCYNHHMEGEQIAKELEDSNLSDLRDRIKSNSQPYPLRLGELKPYYQMMAVENDISLHKCLLNVLKDAIPKEK
jgi:hypothetical protein